MFVDQGKAAPKTDILEFIEDMNNLERPTPNLHHIIIDCTTMGFIDSQGVTYISNVSTAA